MRNGYIIPTVLGGQMWGEWLHSPTIFRVSQPGTKSKTLHAPNVGIVDTNPLLLGIPEAGTIS